LFRHKSRPVWFNLAVDVFGIKYIGKDNLQHLYDALRKETNDIVGRPNRSWHYDKGYVNLSMPKYVMKQLTSYAHPAPVKPQHCPFSPNPITYGKDNQATTLADDSPLLDDAGKKQIQQVV
jgi:hypothetical protein